MVENKKTKLVVAVSHALVKPWDEIKIAQEKTWITNHTSYSQVIFYLSKPSPLLLKKYDNFVEKYRFSKKYGRFISRLNQSTGNFISHRIPDYMFIKARQELVVDSWSTYQLFGRRNLALFDWFVNYTDSDFLFQTTVSSYIQIQNLIEQVKNFDPRSLVYAGAIINPHDPGYKIVSGAGKLLSRELVVKILKNKDFLNFNNLEDVALAELVSEIGARAVDLQRVDLPNMAALEKFSTKELQNHFHFRCKSDSTPRIDSEIMQELHVRLTDKTDK